MASHDNTYSRFIAWAKIILPLVALAVLSTIFLFSRTIDPTRTLTFANVDVQELAREQRVNAPRYAGVTDDGAAVSFAAESARADPQDGRNILAEDVRVTIQSPDGARFDLSANAGALNTETAEVWFQGGVDILTSTGYLVNANQVTVNLNTTNLASPRPIRAVGPLGSIDAGALQLQQENGLYVLVFKDGVKLVYDPGKPKGDAE